MGTAKSETADQGRYCFWVWKTQGYWVLSVFPIIPPFKKSEQIKPLFWGATFSGFTIISDYAMYLHQAGSGIFGNLRASTENEHKTRATETAFPHPILEFSYLSQHFVDERKSFQPRNENSLFKEEQKTDHMV